MGGCKTERRKCTRPQNGQELSLSFDIASIEVYAVYSVASLDETVTHNGIYIAIGSTGNTWLHESCPGDGTVHIRVVSKSNHAACVKVPSSSPGRANSRRAYLHLKVELQWCVCSTAVSYYGCGYGPVHGSREFSGFVKEFGEKL